jgi:hypothetical protein
MSQNNFQVEDRHSAGWMSSVCQCFTKQNIIDLSIGQVQRISLVTAGACSWQLVSAMQRRGAP